MIRASLGEVIMVMIFILLMNIVSLTIYLDF